MSIDTSTDPDDAQQERDLLERTVGDVMGDHCGPDVVAGSEGSWSGPLWRTLHDNGLTAVGVPEAAGGSGGTLLDAAVVLRVAAAHAAPVPLAEALFPVASVCAAGGLPPLDGPATIGSGPRYRRCGADIELEGAAERVAWASVTDRVLLVAAPADASGPELAVWFDPTGSQTVLGQNLAGEPRDDLRVGGTRAPAAETTELPDGSVDLVRGHGALARAVQIAGALSAVLDLTVRYAGERVQFGRPIGRFQAVAHLVAELAGAAVTAEAAAHAAVLAVDRAGRHRRPDPDVTMAIACAKARAGAAAGHGARIAHQVHGAIGFTQEHRLHHLTRRLWSWRDEFGSEEYWSSELGRAVIAAGADELWPSVTRT